MADNDRVPLIVVDGTRQAVTDPGGEVVNVIIAPPDFDPGEGLVLVDVPDDLSVEPGDRLVAGQLTKAPPVERVPTLEERVAALEAQANGGAG